MKTKRNMSPAQLANLKPIQKGQVLNPKGVSNVRVNLTKEFLVALKKDFDEHGEYAITLARENDPVAYIKLIASLVPKEMNLNVKDSVLDQLTDDELRAFLDACRRAGSAGNIIEAECEEVTP